MSVITQRVKLLDRGPNRDARRMNRCRAHMPAFDPSDFGDGSTDYVRRKYPRISGRCRCGFNGIAYASFEHHIAGDW